jgi:hypothetical protein
MEKRKLIRDDGRYVLLYESDGNKPVTNKTERDQSDSTQKKETEKRNQ